MRTEQAALNICRLRFLQRVIHQALAPMARNHTVQWVFLRSEKTMSEPIPYPQDLYIVLPCACFTTLYKRTIWLRVSFQFITIAGNS